MADEKDGTLSVAFKFIDRFFNDFGIWFWLLIFLGVVVGTERLGYVQLDAATKSASSLAVLGVWFCFCMLMNAIGTHKRIMSIALGLFSFFRDFVVYSLQQTFARRHFNKIFLVDCKERDWLVWFIFVYQREHVSFKLEKLNCPYSSYGRWNDECAYALYYNFEILDFMREEKPTYFSSIGSQFDLYARFDLFKALRAVSRKSDDLRETIRKIRSEVMELGTSEIAQSRKRSFYSKEIDAEKQAREAF
jgi:hypothetical protein